MATHSSILAWRIPWTEEPGGLQSMGYKSQTRLTWAESDMPERLSTHTKFMLSFTGTFTTSSICCEAVYISKCLQFPPCASLKKKKLTLSNKQELKTKHNNKLAISQKFVISFLFEGAVNELQMDLYLQFPSVSWGLGGRFLQCHHRAVFKTYTLKEPLLKRE